MDVSVDVSNDTILSGFLADETVTQQFAQAVAEACELYAKTHNEKIPGLVFFLNGDLGAGKSFFSRAFIQTFLPGQKVKSPTYTLVESYPTSIGSIHHFDLYRLCDPEELEFLGFRELLEGGFVSLIEWPSKGFGVLPEKDIEVMLTYEENGRTFVLNSFTDKGKEIARILSKNLGTVIVRSC